MPSRNLSGLALFSLAAVAIAGCGGTTAAKGSLGGTATTAASNGSTTCMAQAKAGVSASSKALVVSRPTSEAISVKPLAGKTIWFISPDQSISFVDDEAAGAQAAATAAGLNFKIFDGKSQPALFNQGLSTAVAQHAAGIILNSIDPSLVSAPLAAAASAKIPVVDVFIGNNPGPGAPATPAGIFADVTNDFPQTGAYMADYALVHTNCSLDGLQVTASTYPSLRAMGGGISAEITRLCPKCNLTTKSVDPTTIATAVAPVVSNNLQRDPKLNFMFAGFDGLITYAAPAISRLGKTIPIIGQAATNTNFDLIRSGGLQVADLAFPPGQYCGWLQVDELLRGMLGTQPVNDAIPTQLVDKSNVGTNDSLSSLYPGLIGYQQSFEKNWGL